MFIFLKYTFSLSWDEVAALVVEGLRGVAGVNRGALGAGGTETGGALGTVAAPKQMKEKFFKFQFNVKIAKIKKQKKNNEREAPASLES